jgi:hypothetical protein
MNSVARPLPASLPRCRFLAAALLQPSAALAFLVSVLVSVNDRLAHNSLHCRCFEVEPVVGFEPTTDGLQNLHLKTAKVPKNIGLLDRNALFRNCPKRKFYHQKEACLS